MSIEDERRPREARALTELVGDDEREAVVDGLQRHHAEGRLTFDEFQERVRLALQSRTVGDLATAAQDLPAPAVTRAPAEQGRHPLRAFVTRHHLGLAATATALGGLAAWWFG